MTIPLTTSPEAAGARVAVLPVGSFEQHGAILPLATDTIVAAAVAARVAEAYAGRRRMVLFPGRADWDRARVDGGLVTSTSEDMHAGELETSILLHVRPEGVRAAYADPAQDVHAPQRPHLLVTGMRGYTESGVIGRPSLATAAKGAAVLDSLVASFADHLGLLDN